MGTHKIHSRSMEIHNNERRPGLQAGAPAPHKNNETPHTTSSREMPSSFSSGHGLINSARFWWKMAPTMPIKPLIQHARNGNTAPFGDLDPAIESLRASESKEAPVSCITRVIGA